MAAGAKPGNTKEEKNDLLKQILEMLLKLFGLDKGAGLSMGGGSGGMNLQQMDAMAEKINKGSPEDKAKMQTAMEDCIKSFPGGSMILKAVGGMNGAADLLEKTGLAPNIAKLMKSGPQPSLEPPASSASTKDASADAANNVVAKVDQSIDSPAPKAEPAPEATVETPAPR